MLPVDLVDDRLDLGEAAAGEDEQRWLRSGEEDGSLRADAVGTGPSDKDFLRC